MAFLVSFKGKVPAYPSLWQRKCQRCNQIVLKALKLKAKRSENYFWRTDFSSSVVVIVIVIFVCIFVEVIFSVYIAIILVNGAVVVVVVVVVLVILVNGLLSLTLSLSLSLSGADDLFNCLLAFL